MDTKKSPNKLGLKLRPHHACCGRFITPGVLDRGEAFAIVERKIIDALKSSTDTVIEVIEGIDDLCQVCPLNIDGRCEAPAGNEEKTRKLDVRILQGLEISYGYSTTANKLRKLVAEKAPFDFCRIRCPRRERCEVFHPK